MSMKSPLLPKPEKIYARIPLDQKKNLVQVLQSTGTIQGQIPGVCRGERGKGGGGVGVVVKVRIDRHITQR